MLMSSQKQARHGKANDAQAAYEILSVLEMSNNWEEGDGDEDDDDDGARSVVDGSFNSDSPGSNVDTDPVDVKALQGRSGHGRASRGGGRPPGGRRGRGRGRGEEGLEGEEGSPMVVAWGRHVVAPIGEDLGDVVGKASDGHCPGNDSLDLTSGGRTLLGGGASADDAFVVLDNSGASPGNVSRGGVSPSPSPNSALLSRP